MKYLFSAILGLFIAGNLLAQELVIYSPRAQDPSKGVFKLFSDTTGISVKIIEVKVSDLAKNPAQYADGDIFMGSDAYNLEMLRTAGVFQSVTTPEIETLSPKSLRGADNAWFATGIRARVIVASKDRVKDGAIKDYEDLTKPQFKGKILVRSAKHPYNTSLISAMIVSEGEAKSVKWVSGIAGNLAQKPSSGDREQMRGIIANKGDVAIVNSYYVGRMLNSKDESDRAVASALRVIFPNQQGRGTHINISGAGVMKAAKNVENAKKFIAFLLSNNAQKMLMDSTYEYPVNASIALNPTLAQWGDFKRESVDFEEYYKHAKHAQKLANDAKWE